MSIGICLSLTQLMDLGLDGLAKITRPRQVLQPSGKYSQQSPVRL